MKDFYAKKREVTAQISPHFADGYGHIISVNPKNNGPVAVSLDNAARCITEGTHRLATADEVRAYRESQELKRAPNTSDLLELRKQFGLLTGRKGEA